jgi:hypothetical protein
MNGFREVRADEMAQVGGGSFWSDLKDLAIAIWHRWTGRPIA